MATPIIRDLSDAFKRGCSLNGRALALHARGTGFDPLHLHFILILA